MNVNESSPDMQWSLVSDDGRASMRLRDTMVIGAGECCDLRLLEDGISRHHVLVTIEDGRLHVIPLWGATTLVDGQTLQGRQHIGNGATLTIGAATFNVRCDECRKQAVPIVASVERSPIDVPRADRVTPPPRRTRGRRRHAGAFTAAFISAGLLAAAAFWFLPLNVFDRPAVKAALPPAPDAASTAAPPSKPASSAVTEPAVAVPREPPAPAPAAEAAPEDDRVARAMTEADSLYAQGALVAPPGRNAATGYVQVLSLAPQNSIARAKLSKIVGQVAVDSQQLMLHQQFNLAHQTIDRLAAAIPANASQFVQADALDRWHVVDLLLRADALMQKYQIAEPEQENAVALLHEALRIDPKNPVGDEMLAKALGMLAETKQRQLVDAPEARAPTSG